MPKNMAVLDKGGIIANVLWCADDFPEIPNERVDITDSPWLRIGDPIDLEAPVTVVPETRENRQQEFQFLLDNLDKQQIRPLATLYVLSKDGSGTSPVDEDILYRTEMQKQAYRNLYDVLMTTPVKEWQALVEAEYLRLVTPTTTAE